MADISLKQVGRVLGSTTMSGIAQKMGQWPPPPAISFRDLASSKCLTQHYDDARTGWNPFETTLTVANVPGLKKLFAQAVDGTIYAQPLYAHSVYIPFGLRNVVFVATENDTVYAFDADTNVPPLWQRSLIPPGEQVVAVGDVEGCNNVAPV